MLKHRRERQRKYVKLCKKKFPKKYKLMVQKCRRQWKSKHKESVKFYQFIYRMKKTGKLTPQPCVECGTTKNIHAHHSDYHKPLNVIWICKKHHQIWHKKHKAKHPIK